MGRREEKLQTLTLSPLLGGSSLGGPCELVERSQGAAKGGRQKDLKEFDHLLSFSGLFRSLFSALFLMLLSLFSSLSCRTPFARLLLRQGEKE